MCPPRADSSTDRTRSLSRARPTKAAIPTASAPATFAVWHAPGHPGMVGSEGVVLRF